MLTGRRVFDGEDVAETLALVLTKEPHWSCCLRGLRSRSAGCSAAAWSGPQPPPRRHRRRAARSRRARRRRHRAGRGSRGSPSLRGPHWAAGCHGRSPPRFSPRRLAGSHNGSSNGARADQSDPHLILLPRAAWDGKGRHLGANLALSPDGRRVAFVATDQPGADSCGSNPRRPSSRPLADTEGATSPFWSPDSRWLAFVANGKLKKMDPAGGPAVTLCDSASSVGRGAKTAPSCSRGTTRLVGTGPCGRRHTFRRHRLDSTPKPDEHRQRLRSFSRTAAISSMSRSGLGTGQRSISRRSTPRERTRMPWRPFPQLLAGLFLFLQGSTLMAQPFDAAARHSTGRRCRWRSVSGWTTTPAVGTSALEDRRVHLPRGSVARVRAGVA